MHPEATRGADIATLDEEMESIYFENKVYWGQGLIHTPEELADYKLRQARLEEIRADLAHSL
jgi:hypothetical protein